MILVVVLGPAAAVGVVTFLLARRWPAPTAPRLGADLVVHELRTHRRLRDLARRRVDPASATGLALTGAAVLAVVGAATVGVLLVMVRTRTGLSAWDGAAARFGAERASDGSTTVLRALTWPGGTAGVLSAATACLVVSGVTPRRGDRRPAAARLGATAAFLTTLVAGQFALSNLIKALVARARPDLHPLTAAAACYLGYALVLGRGRTIDVRAALAGVATGLATAVAATRVLLGVHWLTDVLAGMALGAAWFAATSIAFGGRLLRFGAPVAAAEGLVGAVDRSQRFAGDSS